MKNQTRFQNIVRASRKILLQAGYKPARISMWASGDRHPTYETAQEIAALLKIPLETIPWVKWVKNI